jgi:predicted nuclease with TOPRIM domain
MADNTFNTGTPSPSGPEKPKSNSKNGIIYGVLIAALVGTWGYMWYANNKTNEQLVQKDVAVDSLTTSRNELQQEYEATNARLDDLISENSRMDSLVKTKDKELSDIKARISTILSNKNATQAELAEARRLIEQLKSSVENYKATIERLEGEKIIITGERDYARKERDSVGTIKDSLNRKVDLGSVLHASNIKLSPINLKKNGKEVETSKAKRADMMRVSFDLDDNRIAPSGNKEIYVAITSPDGAPLAVEALGSGRFTLEDGTEKLYTVKKSVSYTTGEKQLVSMDWKQNSDFKVGDYAVEIYHDGFKIGSGKVTLKKGGIF